MEPELPGGLQDAHILIYLDELGENPRYMGESLNWLLVDNDQSLGAEHRYYHVRLYRGNAITKRIPGTEDHLVLGDSWVRGVDGLNAEYPRFHLLPFSAEIVQLEDEWVLGIKLRGHVDKEEHCTDYSGEARQLVNQHLESLRTKFRERFSQQRARRLRPSRTESQEEAT